MRLSGLDMKGPLRLSGLSLIRAGMEGSTDHRVPKEAALRGGLRAKSRGSGVQLAGFRGHFLFGSTA